MHIVDKNGSRGPAVVCALIIACAVVVMTFTPITAIQEVAKTRDSRTFATPISPEWFEPQGLSIVDLVGQVPESELGGMILSGTPGYGIVRYVSGQRIGDTVVVTTTVSPRFVVDGKWHASMFGCLGQPARIDQIGSVSPAATIRLWNGAQDVTREATLYFYVPAGLTKPIRNPIQSEQQNLCRYYESPIVSGSFTSAGELIMPANMGCEIMISYRDYPELTAVFTLHTPPVIKVAVLGYQNFTFHSYLGVGYFGHLRSLADQLRAAGYPDRHEKFALSIPPGADYFMVRFPPMPADAYTAFPGNPRGNLARPTGGTYRVVISPGLSVDHVNSMGLPLYGHWQDSSQAEGQFLNFAKKPMSLAMPEYLLPPGVSYQICMTDGGCPAELLKRIYTTSSALRVLYLQVERLSGGLSRYATQMVGSTWHPGLASSQHNSASLHNTPVHDHFIYLPSILGLPQPDDDPNPSTSGGAGWFTADGRMIDYVPPP